MPLKIRYHCLGVLEGRGGIHPYSRVPCACSQDVEHRLLQVQEPSRSSCCLATAGEQPPPLGLQRTLSGWSDNRNCRATENTPISSPAGNHGSSSFSWHEQYTFCSWPQELEELVGGQAKWLWEQHKQHMFHGCPQEKWEAWQGGGGGGMMWEQHKFLIYWKYSCQWSCRVSWEHSTFCA